MDDGNEKEKLWIVVSVDANAICCVINSELTAFAKARDHIRRNHADMAQSDHDFMHHDSFVDCTKTWVFPTSKVVTELMKNADWMLGSIAQPLRDELVGILKASSTIPPKESVPLCAALSSIKYE